MTESTCRWMIRVGSVPGFLLAIYVFILASIDHSSPAVVGRVEGGVFLALSLLMLKKQSRAAALLLPVLLVAGSMLIGGEYGGMLFIIVLGIAIGAAQLCDVAGGGSVILFNFICILAPLLLVGAWLAGVVGCFIWQSRYAEKAEPAGPVPQDPPSDPRPISEEARRMIEGSVLDNEIPFFEEDGDPTPDEKTKWGAGILAPIGLAIWAIYALVTKHVIMYDKYYRPSVEIKGPAVYACALAMISAALFLHFHYFWGQTPKLYDYYKIPKYTALAVLIISLFTFCILAMSGS